MANEISNTDDLIDVRDALDRLADLEELFGTEEPVCDLETELVESADGETILEDEMEEYLALRDLLDDIRGNGGDHLHQGAWYPALLISEDHFEDYARGLAEDTGAIGRESSWPCNHIDWSAAADELRQDYSTADFNGQTYLYR